MLFTHVEVGVIDLECLVILLHDGSLGRRSSSIVDVVVVRVIGGERSPIYHSTVVADTLLRHVVAYTWIER